MRHVVRWRLVGMAAAAAVIGSSGLVSAQVSFVGEWSPKQHEDRPERGPGPELGDYLGLPINESARRFADSWDAARLSVPEHQCKVHISPYIYRGPLRVRIWETKDLRTQEVISINHYISTYEQSRTIWMDGRPHPSPRAPHTWMGFSTGRWVGDMLEVTTTHIKSEWFRRNGIANSDKTTMVEYFIRHGDVMSHVSISTDPAFLTEPLIRSEEFALDNGPGRSWLWPCEYVEEVDRPRDDIPHFLPGKNPMLHEFAQRYGIPFAATRGGAETMYPEYRAKLHQMAGSEQVGP